MSPEPTMVAHFKHMLAQIPIWESFARSQLAVPGDRPLGVDALAGLPEVAEIAWHGVLAAIDHLLLVRHAAERNNGLPRQVLANHTVARGALLPACRTIWILSADDGVERRQRAYGVAIADATAAKVAANEARQMWSDDPDIAGVAERADVELARIDDLCKTHGLTPRKFSDTDVVKAAARCVQAEQPQLAAALPLTWRRTSGFAHGYLWTGRDALDDPDLDDVISSIGAAVLCTDAAVRLIQTSSWPAAGD